MLLRKGNSRDKVQMLEKAFGRRRLSDATDEIRSTQLFFKWPNLSTYLSLVSNIELNEIKHLSRIAVKSLPAFAKRDGLRNASINDHTGTMAYLSRLQLSTAEDAFYLSRSSRWQSNHSIERFAGEPWKSTSPHTPLVSVVWKANDEKGTSLISDRKTPEPIIMATAKPGFDGEVNIVAAFPRHMSEAVWQIYNAYETSPPSIQINAKKNDYWYYLGPDHDRVPGAISYSEKVVLGGGGRESYEHRIKFYEHVGDTFTRLSGRRNDDFPEIGLLPVVLHIHLREFS